MGANRFRRVAGLCLWSLGSLWLLAWCLPAAVACGQTPADDGTPVLSPQARIFVEDMNGKEITLKPEEKLSLMFLQTIANMESDCKHHAGHLCPLDELIAGPKSENWNIGRLRFDPAKDKNYKYTIEITADKWTAHADPQHKGLGGWFYDGSFFISRSFFNPAGRATAAGTRTGSVIISGDSFKGQ